LQKVNLCSSVHLAFDEFELGDLALCLTVRSRLEDRGPHSGFVFPDANGEGCDQARRDFSNPGIEIGCHLLPQHGMEPLDEFSGFDKRRSGSLNGSNRDGLGLA
jgi:hypothetical protein